MLFYHFSGKALKLLPSEVRFSGLNTPISISAGAEPQTPLEELSQLTVLTGSPSWIYGGY